MSWLDDKEQSSWSGRHRFNFYHFYHKSLWVSLNPYNSGLNWSQFINGFQEYSFFLNYNYFVLTVLRETIKDKTKSSFLSLNKKQMKERNENHSISASAHHTSQSLSRHQNEFQLVQMAIILHSWLCTLCWLWATCSMHYMSKKKLYSQKPLIN